MQKKSKFILVGIIVLVVIIVGILVYKNRQGNPVNDYTNTNYSATNNNQNSTNTNETLTNQATNNSTTTTMDNENQNYTEATLETSMGNITFEFAKDKPLTVNNFIKLAKSGFYNGVRFHRVIQGFMIQTGDPLSKDDAKKDLWGTGGPGYTFADELTGQEQYTMGTVAMANSGPNTNGSQFFIMTANVPLQPNYTVFGQVTAGQDIVEKISEVKTDGSAQMGTGHDRPLEDITIKDVILK